MNQLGLHMLVYTPEWKEAPARRFMEKAKKNGFDFVEVLILDPAEIDAQMTARLADEYELGVVAAVCGNVDADISSPDREVSARGEALIERSINVARDMGATMLGGPTYSAIHRYDNPAFGGATAQATETFGRLALKAEAAGVRVGMEAVNRYESNFINTLDQAAQICRAVGSDSLFVHGDLFHMNIEEAEFGGALRDAADVLGYLHLTESNRGILGTGNFDWTKIFQTLAEIGYTGPITYESFSPDVVGPDLTSLLALWRVPWTDPDEVVPHAGRFIREHLVAASLTSVK